MRALPTLKDLLTAMPLLTALPAATATTKCQSHDLEPANTTRHEMTLLDLSPSPIYIYIHLAVNTFTANEAYVEADQLHLGTSAGGGWVRTVRHIAYADQSSLR